jgi:hypothetical protein
MAHLFAIQGRANAIPFSTKIIGKRTRNTRIVVYDKNISDDLPVALALR